MSIEVAQNVDAVTHKKYLPCQEVEIENGLSYVFHIDRANVFDSHAIYPSMYFARYFGLRWSCINKHTNKYISLPTLISDGRPLLSHGSYEITVGPEYKYIWKSYYCEIQTN